MRSLYLTMQADQPVGTLGADGWETSQIRSASLALQPLALPAKTDALSPPMYPYRSKSKRKVELHVALSSTTVENPHCARSLRREKP